MTALNILTEEVVLLRGSSLLRADTLEEIATLGVDGQWRSPEGAITDAIALPRHAPRAVISPAAAAAAHREQDQAWVQNTLAIVSELARRKEDLTVDDCWTALSMPPRRPSLMSTLMVAGQRQGLIEKTAEHRRSVRPTNGGRTVRVWRSRVYTAPPPPAA
jgi:hypothetical protein